MHGFEGSRSPGSRIRDGDGAWASGLLLTQAVTPVRSERDFRPWVRTRRRPHARRVGGQAGPAADAPQAAGIKAALGIGCGVGAGRHSDESAWPSAWSVLVHSGRSTAREPQPLVKWQVVEEVER